LSTPVKRDRNCRAFKESVKAFPEAIVASSRTSRVFEKEKKIQTEHEYNNASEGKRMERDTGFEPATSSLGSWQVLLKIARKHWLKTTQET